MELKLSIKRVLLDLLSIREQVLDHFQENGRYESLLSFIAKKDYYNDDDVAFPSLVDIEKVTGLKSHILRKQLKGMYQEFFDFEKGRILDFGKTEIWFNLEDFKRHGTFRTNKLPFLPRIGENICVPFLGAKVGTDFFYVQDIRHSLEGNRQIINIYLKGGFFNSYWYLRKHEAIEKGEIGFGESLYEYQAKKKVGLGY